MKTARAASPAPADLLQNSTLYLIGNVAAKILGFAMIPFYSHALSTTQYGVLNLLDLSITLVATVVGLQSIGAALVRVHHDQHDETLRRQAVATAVMGSAALAGLTCLVAFLAAEPIARVAGLAGQVTLIRLAFLGMVFSSVNDLLLTLVRMRGHARIYLAYAMTSLFFTLLLNIVLIGHAHLGVWGFVIARITVTLVGDLFLLADLRPAFCGGFHLGLAKKMVRFAAPLSVSGLCYLTIHFSDMFFLAHVNPSQIAVYGLAYSFAFLLSVLIGNSFAKAWSPLLYAYATEPGWQARFAAVGRWLIFALGVCGTGIALTGRDIITIMAPAAYAPPMLLVPVLVLGYFFREIGEFFNSVLLIGGGSGLAGRIALAVAALDLLLNALLIPSFGLWGAASATLASWCAYCALGWACAWRLQKLLFSPRSLSIMLALSACAVWLHEYFQVLQGVLRLAADAGLFSLFVAVAAFSALDAAERKWLLALTKQFGLRLAPTPRGAVSTRA